MNQEKGLSSKEVKEKLLKFGPNQIFVPAKISFFDIFKHEIAEPMILLLLIVGFFYSIWGKFEDAITIFVIIFLLVLIETVNEFRAKKAIASLEKIAAPRTRVLRDGRITTINSEDVVPGDILILTLGTKIAADAEIIYGIELEVDESALTGESFPQKKKAGDKIYAGTIIVSGEGKAKVFATGKNTQFGKISKTLPKIKPPKTTLQLAMKSLAGKLVFVALFFSIAIPILGILRGQNIKTMILTGLSLSFATVPEELPIIITMVLGLGAYTLSKSNFLIKKIKAAEILGNATVIVTDKTGTITSGKMEIVSLYPKNREKEIIEKAFCALPEYTFSPLDQEIKNKAQKFQVVKIPTKIVRQRNFGNGRKTRTVIRKCNGEYKLFMTGAPEEILTCCSKVSPDIKKELNNETAKGRKVIAIAYKKILPDQINLDFSDLEKETEFFGLISFEDPERPSVFETIKKASKAGIKTIMVTGDHPKTARFIAKKVGIPSDNVLSGGDIDKLSDKELQSTVKKISIFARTTPQHKYRIVKALQKNNEVVAVTGDGINDALALKAADIGIAMGIKGTDVAREAAEVVLADDNYITITKGIFEGRKFFDNLQKGIKYYLSVKTALILIFLLPVILGMPLPFAPIQIILLELFMDLAASAGFVAEPAEKDIHQRSPRNPKENIFGKKTIYDILIKGFILFFAVTSIYFYARYKNLSFIETQTMAFTAWIFGHIMLAFVSRSDKIFFLQGIFSNKIITLWALFATLFLILGIYSPFLQSQLNLTAINPIKLVAIALVTVLIIGLLEIRKLRLKSISG